VLIYLRVCSVYECVLLATYFLPLLRKKRSIELFVVGVCVTVVVRDSPGVLSCAVLSCAVLSRSFNATYAARCVALRAVASDKESR
jgi:hypothetical protein